MKASLLLLAVAIMAFPLDSVCCGQRDLSAKQLQELLQKFPAADANGDGQLSRDEAIAYRNKFPAIADWL